MIQSDAQEQRLSSFCEQCRACLDEQDRGKYNTCTLDFYVRSKMTKENVLTMRRGIFAGRDGGFTGGWKCVY